MSKLSARILCLAICATMLLAACQSSPAAPSNDGVDSTASTEAPAGEGGSPADPVTVNVLTYRNPANEFFVEAMKNANLENINVEVRMGSYDQYMEQSQLAFSTQNSPYHLIYAYDEFYARFIHNDWIAPVDEYIEKYREEYELDDIPKSMWDALQYNGSTYCIPYQQNLQFFLYRKDIFEKYDLTPPRTFDDMFGILDILKGQEDVQYPISIPLAKPDTLYLEFINAIHSFGGSMFDDNNYPTFNSNEGVEAIQFMQRLVEYMPPGALTQNTDDTMVGLQQGSVVTSNMWATRIAAMEDDTVSNYVGMFETSPAPVVQEGGTPLSNLAIDMWVIPKNIDIDPEIPFRVVMESLRPENAKEAAPLSISIRQSVLEDAEIVDSIPYYKAAVDTINDGAKGMSNTPATGVCNDIVSYYVSLAIEGSMDPMEALDKAAEEVTTDLQDKGYIVS